MAEETQAAEPTTTPEPHGEGTDWKAEARKWQQRAKENRDEARAYREQAEGRADYDEVVAERDRLAGEMAHRDLVARVADATGVPARLLRGDTEDELVDFAAALKAYAESQRPAWPTDKGGAAGHAPAQGKEDRLMEALGL